jgi:hypothetical protein
MSELAKLRGENAALRKELALWREAHAQHKYEGWCPLCNPIEYAAAGLNMDDIEAEA